MYKVLITTVTDTQGDGGWCGLDVRVVEFLSEDSARLAVRLLQENSARQSGIRSQRGLFLNDPERKDK